MKAIILAGGFGTRLRPLTLSRPKPLVEFVDKPMVLHQIEALAKVKVTHVILAVNYLPHLLEEAAIKVSSDLNIKLSISVEDEPLDTAGPLALAKALLEEDGYQGDFFVLNSDVMCTFPLDQMVQFHRNHGNQASIMVTRVEEPSKYGVIVYDQSSGLVDRFVEKPKTFVGNMINAGIYLFKMDVLEEIELRPTSMERDVFPSLATKKQLYCFPLKGFWMDVGQPRDFLRGCALYLSHMSTIRPEMLRSSSQMDSDTNVVVIKGHVYMDKSVECGHGCVIGPNVAIDKNVKIGVGVRLKDCVVLAGARINSHSWISNTIVGWNCRIGKWTRIENVSVLGEDVKIKDELYMNGICILPHKSIAHSIASPKVVM